MQKLRCHIVLSILVMVSLSLPLLASAEPCTYREAIMAYQNGNTVRGDALMKIAANDGDNRAVVYLHALHQNTATELKPNSNTVMAKLPAN